jgi:hypothetical protein
MVCKAKGFHSTFQETQTDVETVARNLPSPFLDKNDSIRLQMRPPERTESRGSFDNQDTEPFQP